MIKFLIKFIFAFGITFSIIQFIKKNMEGREWAYPALLASFPFFYFIFALWVNDKNALKNEFLAAIVFFLIVGLYLRYRSAWTEYLLVAGFFLHAAYDVSHDWFLINLGVPSWWGGFCALVDVFIGIYLVFQIKKHLKLVH